MRRCGAGVRIALAIAALALVARGADEPRLATTRTAHYDVATDVSPEFTKLVGEHMEAIYKAYEERFKGYNIKRDARFTVKVFARQADYYAALPAKMHGSTGAFVSSLRLLAAFREGRTDEMVFRTLYHEGFHQFLYTCVTKRAPLWVNEGLAEYFSEATWNGKGFTAGQVPTAPLHVVQTALKRRAHIPLAELLALDSDSWLAAVRGDADRSALQYAQAWSVVHFLVHGKKGQHRPRLLGYLKRMSEGVAHEEAFRQSFGTDIASFEKAWARYVTELKPGRDAMCRRNLDMLGHLSLAVYQDPADLRSVSDLRKRLMDKRMTWAIRSTDGQRVDSRNRKDAMRLFVCPRARGASPVSYVIARDPQTGLPLIACKHHRSVVMMARFRPKPDGGYTVATEQAVTATVPPELARALKKAR